LQLVTFLRTPLTTLATPRCQIRSEHSLAWLLRRQWLGGPERVKQPLATYVTRVLRVTIGLGLCGSRRIVFREVLAAFAVRPNQRICQLALVDPVIRCLVAFAHLTLDVEWFDFRRTSRVQGFLIRIKMPCFRCPWNAVGSGLARQSYFPKPCAIALDPLRTATLLRQF
jgi:hypothetical protein